MATPILMPKQGITVESCILTKWNVKVGDKVKVGDVLFSFETDKSSIDFISETEGEVLALFCNEGDEVPVLTNVMAIGKKGEDVSALSPAKQENAAVEITAAPLSSAENNAEEKVVDNTDKAKTIPKDIKAKPVTMPKSGITVESCILTKMNVKAGDKVKIGDNIFSYETDKSSFDYQAEEEGEVLAVFYSDGDEIPVGENVLVLGEHGVDASCFAPGGAVKPAEATLISAETPAAAPEQSSATQSAPTEHGAAKGDNGRIFASPRARNLAAKLGVSLSQANGSGPNGRIIERDIREAALNPVSVAEEKPVIAETVRKADVDVKAFKDEKMSSIRKVIAKNMVLSLSTMAQLTHTLSFDCTNVLAFRKYLKDNAEKLKLPPITVNNVIVFAVSRVLKNHRDLNANLINGDTMRYFEHTNIGIATDTPRGLLVPTLFGADMMSLSEIAIKSKKLSADAIDGKLSPDLLTGGSFTVSNVGTMGIESFTPVVNPPQTGILGVNTMETRIKLGAKGEIIPYTAMSLSLSYDHRALDGAPASRFLKELKEYLENFSLNLLADGNCI